MFEFLFIDLDDTVLDFKKAEQTAIRKTLSDAGLNPTDSVCQRYSQINDMYWKMLERGELTRPQVLVGRFRVLFEEFSVPADPEQTAQAYMNNLSQGHYFLPGAEEALEKLSKKYRLFLASNGTASVQRSRLKSANISRYFESIFISQDIGVNKPAKEYFTKCFEQIADFDPAKAMIVGDSLTSDIQGGKNAGIATCWVNPGHKECALEQKPDFEIESISQLEGLLARL